MLLWIMAAILLTACANRNIPAIANATPAIHSIHELNREDEPLDSHAGEEASSVLEMDFNSYTLIPASLLGVEKPVYARIKKAKNGSYLLFYQDGRIASDIYYTQSSDLKTWLPGKLLFKRKLIKTTQGEDSQRYSSADATVLSNGDILSVVSYRAGYAYKTSPEANGIMMRRSKDNGLTWGEEQVIYCGTNWEPYILELPGGKLQCYFTDTDPLYRNSGTSIVISEDGGNTWSPKGVSNNYKVIRQYKYMNQGKRIYTDQMACVRLLNDGQTLAGFMESRLEDHGPDDKNSKFLMSLVYGKNDWPRLSGDEVGPPDRQSNLFAGAGGYLAQFRSGETVVSCNIDRKFSMKVGDSKARHFNHNSWSTDWFQPFSGLGFWGSLEIDDAHFIIGTMHTDDGIMISRFFLNHRINASAQKISVDANIMDWKNTDALFIGSDSKTQTSFRAARDAANLYLLIERKDDNVLTGDNIALYIHNNEGKILNTNSIKITIAPTGVTGYAKWSGSGWVAANTSVLTVANKVVGTVDKESADGGYLSEIRLPFSEINTKEKYIRFNAVVTDGAITDSFTSADAEKPGTWMLIKK